MNRPNNWDPHVPFVRVDITGNTNVTTRLYQNSFDTGYQQQDAVLANPNCKDPIETVVVTVSYAVSGPSVAHRTDAAHDEWMSELIHSRQAVGRLRRKEPICTEPSITRK